MLIMLLGTLKKQPEQTHTNSEEESLLEISSDIQNSQEYHSKNT